MDSTKDISTQLDEDAQKMQQKILDEIKQKPNLSEKIKLSLINLVLVEKKLQDVQMEQEIKALKNKYEQLSKPLYDKINNILNGIEKIEEQCYKKLTNLAELEKEELKLEEINSNKLEQYWQNVLKNCEIIAPELQPQDEEALKSLYKLEYSTDPLSYDFSLIFYFHENDYFQGCVIKKDFGMKDDQTPIKSSSNEIPWKKGKKLTEKMVKKKQKSKTTGEIRITEKAVAKESFFNFFNNIDKDQKEKSSDDCGTSLELQFDIASYIMEEAIPYSLECYLGIKVEGDDEFEDLDEDDDFEEQIAAFENKKKVATKKEEKQNKNEDKQDEKGNQNDECKQQ